ncbi:MAG TPA: TlpA disulfide reductase family protein [Candidatus Thermoplasmatota archaeon]|nr:TlpA disulfide reductase family protein [Candidatus Thermoplasmatota archaeon]
MRVLACVVLLVAVPALAGCVGMPERVSDPRDLAGPDRGVAWAFRDTDGALQTNTTAEGRPAVLFFMASWCLSCRSKAPMLAEVVAENAPRGLRAYSLSFDPKDDEETLRRWKAEFDNDWPHGVDPQLQVARHFGITAQSSFVVIDARGDVVQQWGYPGPSEDALRAAVDQAFARG